MVFLVVGFEWSVEGASRGSVIGRSTTMIPASGLVMQRTQSLVGASKQAILSPYGQVTWGRGCPRYGQVVG